MFLRLQLLLALVFSVVALVGSTALGGELDFDCDSGDCSRVLPGAVRFEMSESGKYWQAFDAGDELLGWVALSRRVVDIKGYSGKPIVTLVGLGLDGSIQGVEIVEHSEPILLLGIPEEDLREFTDSFVGLPAIAKVSVGGSSNDPNAVNIDAISGATVTVLAEERTIMETTRQLGVAVGVVKNSVAIPGHFAEVDTVLTWAELDLSGILGRLTVTQLEVGKDAYGHDESDDADEPFIDLWYTLADAPHVGRSLLGAREYKWAMEQLSEGEHLFVLFGNGTSSFKGSGFVRGGIFDRIRVEQGLNTVMFIDRDYHRLSRPRAEGAPRFKESAWFRVPAFQLDPGRPMQLVFLASRFSGKGAFDRIFSSFVSEHQLPNSVYVLDGPDPNEQIWRGAWRIRPWKTAIVVAFLLAVVAAFVGRKWLTADLKRLKKIHIGTQVAAFLILGVWLHIQPSVTQILTFFDSIFHGWRWGLFLSDPALWVSWIFIVAVTLVWGRGVFCGWVCPYGAMNEVTFLVANKLGLPSYELPDSVHRVLRYLRYGVFLALLAAFLYSAPIGERFAEVEPFKSTFFVPFWNRGGGFVAWWVFLALVSLVMYRPFCRYLCPLGAALAALSMFRRTGPYRRDFCTHCKICTRGCEPRAIRPNGTIDPKECLSCMECEANYGDDQVCPPLVKNRRAQEAAAKFVVVLLGVWGIGVNTEALATTHVVSKAGHEDIVLQNRIDAASPGDTLVVSGRWMGNFEVGTSITILATDGEIDAEQSGTPLRVLAPDVVVDGLSIRGSGDDLRGPDSGIWVGPEASRVVLRGNTIRDIAFGIWVHETVGAQVVGNTVFGRKDVHPSNRGNGIHLFDCDSTLVSGNHVVGARDGIYISATENSVFEENLCEDQRFGVHYMFSHGNTLRNNNARNNKHGFALMQSSDMLVEGNRASGSTGHGILFRDAQRCVIRGNELVDNVEGLFFYSSTENEIYDNLIENNEVGAKVWAGTLRNEIYNNQFIGNRQQVFYVSASDLVVGESGRGNFWSDYLGWDQDGDGIGDRAYRVDSFTSTLLYRFPSTAVLLRSPALELLSHLQATMPLLKTPTLIDQSPQTVRPVR